MPGDQWDDLVSAILLGLAALVGAVSIALARQAGARRDEWQAITASLREDLDRLADRVTAAEAEARSARAAVEIAQARAVTADARADKLGRRLASALTHIEALYAWVRSGATPPPPAIPDTLRDHLDLGDMHV